MTSFRRVFTILSEGRQIYGVKLLQSTRNVSVYAIPEIRQQTDGIQVKFEPGASWHLFYKIRPYAGHLSDIHTNKFPEDQTSFGSHECEIIMSAEGEIDLAQTTTCREINVQETLKTHGLLEVSKN